MIKYPPQTYMVKFHGAEYNLADAINAYHNKRLYDWPEYIMTEIVQFTVLPDKVDGYVAFVLFKVEYFGE